MRVFPRTPFSSFKTWMACEYLRIEKKGYCSSPSSDMSIQYGHSSQGLKSLSENTTVQGSHSGLVVVCLPRDSLTDTQPGYSRSRVHEDDRMCQKKFQSRAYKPSGEGPEGGSLLRACTLQG